jgi:hypothetical protein
MIRDMLLSLIFHVPYHNGYDFYKKDRELAEEILRAKEQVSDATDIYADEEYFDKMLCSIHAHGYRYLGMDMHLRKSMKGFKILGSYDYYD